MNKNIRDIARELESFASNSPNWGFRSGLTGISLFFFYYTRFTGEEKYGELANEYLGEVLSNAPDYTSYYFASKFADIGKTVDFLAKEKFLEIDTAEFFDYFDKILFLRLKKDLGIDFGFQSGMIGICDFFLKRKNEQEAVNIILKHLYSGLRVKGYPKHPVESLFLFPSEVLRDVKIFLLKLKKANIALPQKELLDNAVRKFEFKKRTLRSNCFEYSVLQDLREAGIMEDQQKIRSLLETIATTSSNLIFKGFVCH